MNVVSGLPAFLAYLGAAFGLMAAYLVVYLMATAHREIALIRSGNVSAALALGGSLVGYSLPLSMAVRNAQSILDCLVWGLIGLVVQVGVYLLMRYVLPGLSERIEADEISAAILLGTASLAAGIVNAACMSY